MTVKSSQRKAQANLLTTVSKLRLSSKIDTLSQSDMQSLEGAIQVQLELYSGH